MDARGSTINYVAGNQQNVYLKDVSSDRDTILQKLKPVDREHYYIAQCMDGTRLEILEQVDHWLLDEEEEGHNILWISGSPGAGKSAILSSLEKTLRENGRLGSAFYFKRGDAGLSNPASLWRTVAYDLAQSYPQFAEMLVDVLKDRKVDPARSDIITHFAYLVRKPLSCFEALSSPTSIPVILIDALDECDADRSQPAQRKALLETFLHWSCLSPKFKLIITGRDDQVPDIFRTICTQIILPTGDGTTDSANSDIRRYFEDSFAEIGGDLYPEWPSPGVLDTLTMQAAGLFVWATTVVELLKQGLPDEELELVLKGGLGEGDNLTKLYRQILEFSFAGVKDNVIQLAKSILGAIIFAQSPLHSDDLYQLLLRTKPSVKFVLDKLTSVITSPGWDGGRLHICHLSFRDFLCDSQRSPPNFFLDAEEENRAIAMACFRTMRDSLKFNIWEFDSSYRLNFEVHTEIPGALSYASRFWSHHTREVHADAAICAPLLQEIDEFLHDRMLFWLEVMSGLSEIPSANIALLKTASWAQAMDQGISERIEDSRRFVVDFEYPISRSVPHIYISALPFSPANSFVAKQYSPKFANTFRSLAGGLQEWTPLLNTLRGHTSWVTSVAPLPDGKSIVSGSRDSTIRIWDIQTGELTAGPYYALSGNCLAVSPDGTQILCGSDSGDIELRKITGEPILEPFKAHQHAVLSVSFSPSGTHFVSGGSDRTSKIWQANGVNVGVVQHHLGRVESVAFSPDGKRVISGSSDKTILIYDANAGDVVVGPCRGHPDWVRCVQFSPNGQVAASGSDDNTIIIWDAEKGKPLGSPLQGHTGHVTSIAFSQNGKRLVSGSADGAVVIWDVEQASIIAGPFRGHTDRINSVAFSMDGTKVISASHDDTMRIWDAVSEWAETPSRKSRHHADSVRSIAFSPDGKTIATGSLDKTVLIWDTDSGEAVLGPLKGHTSWVWCVAFSPDGTRLVTGSDDHTVLIWDANNGEIIAGPFHHHTHSVSSVTFSPNSELIASGSDDKTIVICNANNGGVVAGPFRGHTLAVESIAFSPDGKSLASGSSDFTIRIWDALSGVETMKLHHHKGRVTSVIFSPDGTRLASASEDRTILIYDAISGSVVAGPLQGHTGRIWSIAFSPDSTRIASGSYDKTIRLWKMNSTGCPCIAAVFEGHSEPVWSVAFSPDGKKLGSGSRNGKCRIWNAEFFDVDEIQTTLGNLTSGSKFLISDTGWVMKNMSQRLLWVPHSAREGLGSAETLAIMGKSITKLDLRRFVHGHSWQKCHSDELGSQIR